MQILGGYRLRIVSGVVFSALLTSVAFIVQPVSASIDTPPTSIIPYQSTGWKYEEVAQGDNPGFQNPSYDDSSWASGQAGFGTTDGVCPWNNTSSVHTNWDPNTDILLRKHFTV